MAAAGRPRSTAKVSVEGEKNVALSAASAMEGRERGKVQRWSGSCQGTVEGRSWGAGRKDTEATRPKRFLPSTNPISMAHPHDLRYIKPISVLPCSNVDVSLSWYTRCVSIGLALALGEGHDI